MARYVEKAPDPPPPKPVEPPAALFTSNMPGKKVRIQIGAGVEIPLAEIPLRDPKPLILTLKQRAVFKNPAFAIAKKENRPLPHEYHEAYAINEETQTMTLPKGDLKSILDIFQRLKVPVDFIDTTTGGRPLEKEINTTGSLSEPCEGVFSALSGKRYGILAGGQGGEEDKRVTSQLISFHGLRTLIVVKRKWQLHVWKRVLMAETDLADGDIGLVGDGHKEVDRLVTIGIDRSLYVFVPHFSETIGFLVVDGADMANAKIFFNLVWKIPARFLLGVAAMPKRRDGLTDMMRLFLGGTVVEIPPGPPFEKGGVAASPISVVVSKMDFPVNGDTFEDIMSNICVNIDRTRRIFGDILSLVAEGRRVLVVGPRIKQLEEIQGFLMRNFRTAETITGQTSEAEIFGICRKFKDGDISVVGITSKTLGGVPLPLADVAVIAAPYRSMETAAQIVRLVKPGGWVFDYADPHVFMDGALRGRVGFYRKLNLVIREGLVDDAK
jgi:hypothetical protein